MFLLRVEAAQSLPRATWCSTSLEHGNICSNLILTCNWEGNYRENR